jgi:H+/gluconate symporter-like permease
MGTQKAQGKRRKKRKPISIFLCAFCVGFALFVFPVFIILLTQCRWRFNAGSSEL